MRFKQFFFFTLFFTLSRPLFAQDSNSIAIADTPSAVQKTISTQVGDGKISSIEKSFDDGENVFDVDFTGKDNQEQDFTVAEDGTLLSVEVEWAAVPAAVQKTISAQASGFELESIDKNLDDTEISYDVETTLGAQTKNFTVGEDGEMISAEIGFIQTPATVQTIIQTQIADGKLKSIEEMFDDENGNTYDVTASSKSGAEKSFTVTADGKLSSEEVVLEKVPGPARKTIKARIGDGTILRVDKSLLEKKLGVLPYEVEGRKDGKTFDFSVGPRGRFLGMD
jgi:uncharacterized membrane protein YkoI